MLIRKALILAKKETTYGADPTPTVAANALLVRNLKLTPVGDPLERDLLRSTLSNLPFVRGIQHYELSFETELKGTGTAGSLPAFGWEGVLFQACRMTETISAGVSITYEPNSDDDGGESCTIYVYAGGGVLHQLHGCRGTFKMNFEAGNYGTVAWKFNGLYEAPTDASPSSATYSDIVPPRFLNVALTVDSYSPVFEKFEIDINNTVAARKNANSATGITEWIISGRKPQGSFDPEATLEATNPFWDDWNDAAEMALTCTLGATAGNIITISAPAIQYRDIAWADRNGILAYEVPFSLAEDSGNDELSIVFT